MLNERFTRLVNRQTQRGTTLLEVLVTIVILTFGLLGLAGLQGQVLLAESESFQRAQAILMMNDMIDRIAINRSNAATYVRASPVGTGDSLGSFCGAVTSSSPAVVSDTCDWRNTLRGASEGGGASKGSIVGGRGCIELVTAENAAAGVCTPGVYRVTGAWQGASTLSIPVATCGAGSYGDDRYRRAVSSQVSIGLPTCQ